MRDMDNMIREMVDIDRVARERVEAAEAWRVEQLKNIEIEKSRLDEEYVAQLKRELDDFIANAHADRDLKIDELSRSSSIAIKELEELFKLKSSEWVNAIYDRVIEL